MAAQFLPYTHIDASSFLPKALHWAMRWQGALFLDHNGMAYPHGTFPRMLAVGTPLTPPANVQPFEWLQAQWEQHGWLFGHLGYDLKNHLEALQSNNPDSMGFPDMAFFPPEHLLIWEADGLRIQSATPQALLDAIRQTPIPTPSPTRLGEVVPQMPQAQYLRTVERIRQYIEEGDVYELNCCMEFVASEASIDPVAAFLQLHAQSPMPFAALLKCGERFALSASPERFLKKEGNTLISQPIKGTIKRGHSAPADEALKQRLRNSEKEQAENMMIVDLVRNDLARSAQTGTVEVEEMFGIYTFRQLHQMISTVTAQLHPHIPPLTALARAFPMGSMTGAPKVRSMQRIEALENRRRNLFSGAIGYLNPHNDFDFNVVIRTLFYNRSAARLSFQVGSAITYDAIPAQEYEECLLKASAILNILQSQ